MPQIRAIRSTTTPARVGAGVTATAATVATAAVARARYQTAAVTGTTIAAAPQLQPQEETVAAKDGIEQAWTQRSLVRVVGQRRI